MSQYKIGLIIGSLRKESYNRRLGEALTKLARPEFIFNQVQIGNLPLYNQDDEAHPSVAVTGFKEQIRSAQGFLFVTPEYNRSIPGGLKNALDQGSTPKNQNYWSGKPAGIIGVSAGVLGTAMAQQHLRNILAALNMPVLCQPEAFIHYKKGLFDEDGNIGADSNAFLKTWMEKFMEWVIKHTSS